MPGNKRRRKEMLDESKIQDAVRLFLDGIGEDTQREGLRDTPVYVH